MSARSGAAGVQPTSRDGQPAGNVPIPGPLHLTERAVGQDVLTIDEDDSLAPHPEVGPERGVAIAADILWISPSGGMFPLGWVITHDAAGEVAEDANGDRPGIGEAGLDRAPAGDAARITSEKIAKTTSHLTPLARHRAQGPDATMLRTSRLNGTPDRAPAACLAPPRRRRSSRSSSGGVHNGSCRFLECERSDGTIGLARGDRSRQT